MNFDELNEIRDNFLDALFPDKENSIVARYMLKGGWDECAGILMPIIKSLQEKHDKKSP